MFIWGLRPSEMLPGVGCYVSRYWVNDQQFPLRSLCQKSKDLNYDVAEA